LPNQCLSQAALRRPDLNVEVALLETDGMAPIGVLYLVKKGAASTILPNSLSMRSNVSSWRSSTISRRTAISRSISARILGFLIMMVGRDATEAGRRLEKWRGIKLTG
jgi:hypothetical protein